VADAGLKVPKDIGLVHLDLSPEHEDWAGMHQNEVSRIETGKQDPTLSRVVRIVDALGAELLVVSKEAARLLDTRISAAAAVESTAIQDARDDAGGSHTASRRFDVSDEDV
jgi:predicted transcriptional regulator